MYDAFLWSFDLDALVRSLVAFEFRTAGGLVAHEALFAFQYQYRTIDEVEIVFAIVVDYVGRRV